MPSAQTQSTDSAYHPAVPVAVSKLDGKHEEELMLNQEECWQAILRRDREHDGRFFFGVLTTGIFCRPSCPARRPRRENVRFYRAAAEAEADGLRPCRRCHPLDRAADLPVARIRQLCDHIREHCDSGDRLTLAVLAERAGVAPARLRRVFREVVGVTPRQYVETCRFEALKGGLRAGEPVTRAIYDAGFGSSSQVYEQTGKRLGMTPGDYRAGGLDLTISYALIDTPAGRTLLAATDRGLCSIQLGMTDEELVERLREEFPAATLRPMKPSGSDQLELWATALGHHLAGREPHPDLPLDVRGTAFQLRVWSYLRSIPVGETRSYSRVARDIGQPTASRAVAGACAANRLALVIPCHRVIRADGDLGGYRWGRERKQRLLEREREASRD